jgi:hypothetical protein
MGKRITESAPASFFGLLTILWPGLGHVLFGQMGKGIILAVVPFFTIPLTGMAGINPGIGLLAVTLPATIDVVILALRVRSGTSVGRWQFCFDTRAPAPGWEPDPLLAVKIPWGAIIGLILGLLLLAMGLMRLLLAWNL